MKKKLKIIIPLVIVIAAVALVARHLLDRGPFRYAGTVEATKVDVPSRVSSVIKTLYVHEGDTVHDGQLLLTLSCEDLKIDADQARRDFDRSARLVRQGFVSPQAYDQAKSHYEDTHLKVSWCAVKAPLTGTVLTRYHEPGESVAPGTPLFTLADLRRVWAYIYVPAPVIPRLHLGMQLTAYIPELHDETRVGTVAKINDEAEFTPKNVQTQAERTRLVYGVKVEFQNADGVLKPGMTVEIPIEQRTGA